MKIMLHACPKRMWYVNDFLIPSLKSQGIDDILLWNDEKQQGNLASFIASAKYVKDNLTDLGYGLWHIQDDILLSSKFKAVIEKAPKNIICNGISTVDRALTECTGIQPISNTWFSFPCIYIPNTVLAGFYDWFIFKCMVEKKHQNKIKLKKYDDFFFYSYMKMKHKNAYCYNIAPNIVQHVDYLIGGRIANANLKGVYRANHWNEEELEKELEKDLIEWRKRHE